jgi:predicted dithiol-disulfide oxidoreductase (DUF899 family)
MVAYKVVSHDAWVAARKKHLAKEKEFTHLRDQLSRERRELPWELVDKDYSFEGERGKVSLHDLFEGRNQLVIYHAMFNPETAGPQTTWTADAASCSRVLLIGMSNLIWMIVLSALVLVYKLAPVPTRPRMVTLSAALVLLGVLYAMAA